MEFEILETQDKKIKPNYYKSGKGDVIDFCNSHNLGFLEGNIIKYVTRWKGKNGLEDLKKANEYLTRLIEYAERGE